MTTVRLRPTFTVPLGTDRESAIEEIRARLVADERFAGRWRGKGRWAEIFVPDSERRFWSPHLSVRLDEDSDGCRVFARFAPHPEIWTFFIFLYFAIGFLVVLGGILSYVQWVSNESAWGVWSLWVGIPLLGLIHFASALGQRWGHGQMVALKSELEELLEGL